jgi:DNA-binding response OmpR family regulator
MKGIVRRRGILVVDDDPAITESLALSSKSTGTRYAVRSRRKRRSRLLRAGSPTWRFSM